MGGSTCPLRAMTSFPLGIDFTPTPGFYTSLSNDNKSLVMQWGVRLTKPGFSGQFIDEQTGTTSTTTLRYDTNTYHLTGLQITKPTHTSWLLPVTSQPLNKEDILFMFTTTSTSSTAPIIILIVPVVRNGTARTDPVYLMALDSGEAGAGPFPLKDCLPDKNYIKYTTCLKGYSTEASSANAIVYVNTTGLSVSATLMAAIQKNNFGGNPFPIPIADFMQKYSLTQISVTAETIKTHVSVSSSPFQNYVPPSDAPPNTDNYKCMPLDMTQIQTSDLSGAKTLTQILLPEARDMKILNPGMTEYVLTIVIGVTMGLLILGVGFLTVSNVVIPAIAPAAGAAVAGAAGGPTLVQRLYDVRFYILAGFVGVFIGGLASYFTTKKPTGK